MAESEAKTDQVAPVALAALEEVVTLGPLPMMSLIPMPMVIRIPQRTPNTTQIPAALMAQTVLQA